MSGRELTPAEKAAGEMVAEALGGSAISRDGERGSHDFDIELPDGRTIALEVTAAADGGLVAVHASRSGNEWPAPS